MNVLYVADHKNSIRYEECYEDKVYIINISNTNAKVNNAEIKEINIINHTSDYLKLGPKFMMSYKIMNTVKWTINEYSIDKVIFSCKYIDSYFSLQYLIYGGELERTIEICDLNCYKESNDIDTFKFPEYWINKIESKCMYLFKKYKNNRVLKLTPKLSIIIPYYNLSNYIYEALESIRKSTYKNYEIIIVNDGSNDSESINILRSLEKDEDLKIINQENKGLSAARNIGVENSTGEYVTFLDADDLVEKEYYKRAINVLESYSDVDIAYSWVKYFENKEEIWPTFDLSMPYLLLSNMSAAFYVVRKTKYISYGLNDETMKQGMEDYNSLINMYKNGCEGISIPDPLVKYRYRLGSMSKSFKPDIISNIYNNIVDNHKELYKEHSIEIIKIINTNGPGYLWNNPTLSYPSVCLNSNEDVNDVKYILIKLINTRLGKVFVKLLKYYCRRK